MNLTQTTGNKFEFNFGKEEEDVSCRKKTMEIISKIEDIKKEEPICEIVKMLVVLPTFECQRICGYLSELYFS